MSDKIFNVFGFDDTWNSPVWNFLKFLKQFDSKNEKTHVDEIEKKFEYFLNSTDEFNEVFNTYKKMKADFYEKIKDIPLIYIISIWAKRQIKDNELGHSVLKSIEELLEKGIIPITNRDGSYFSLGQFSNVCFNRVIRDIRCSDYFNFYKREMLVIHYMEFSEWLSDITMGVIYRAIDKDRSMTEGKELKFMDFMNFMNQLNEKYHLIAKLIYFGGVVSLDEILSIDIKNVFFDDREIQFSNVRFRYPSHVFNDIKRLVGDKKEGRIFLGRESRPLNPSTIFRNFSEAAKKAGLGSDFTPNTLSSATYTYQAIG